MKTKTLWILATISSLATAANVVIVDGNGNPVGECDLLGAAIAQGQTAEQVSGVTVTPTAAGDMLLVIDQAATGCAIGTATNQAPSFTQSSPFNAGSVSVSSSRLISLSASDPDGDPLTWSIATQPASGMGTASVSGTGNSNTVTYTAGTTAGTAQFVVRVSDGRGGSTDLTVNVTVTTTQLPAACNSINPGIPADTSRWGLSTEVEFTPLEPGTSFANVSVETGKYKYKQTYTINPGDSGRILFEDTAYYEIGQKMISLSECPGDFGGSGTVAATGCVITTNTTGIATFYYRTPTAAQTFGCVLDPGKTYYLNVVHATDPNNLAGSNTCSTSVCGFNIDTFEN